MKIMKAIYRIITAATVASLALVSCSKELNPPDSAETGGLGEERVITLTFDDATKSQISGYHPTFKAGDKILLSNGTAKQECTVSVDTYGTATVTTTLTGTLKAVYPAGAAALSGNAITGVQVSSTQHGTFAEANIAMAEDIQPNGMARFKLKTAVLRFYVDSSIGVKSITITSGGADIATGFKTISVTPASPSTYLHQMTTGHPDSRLCYVAVLPGVAASDLTFTSDTESQGIVTRQSPGTGTLAVKGMYDAFIPYYIKIHIGPGVNDCQKWGYCNIGAFLPEEYGEYFAWGEIKGHPKDNLAASFPAANPDPTRYTGGWNAANGFSYRNAPYNNKSDGPLYSTGKYHSGDGGLQVLEPSDDAAYVNWGPCWCIPSPEDFIQLFPGSAVTFNGITGRQYGSGSSVFFPNGGIISGLAAPTDYDARYWANKVWPNNAEWAYGLRVNNGSDTMEIQNDRYLGRPIRPIYKTPAGPLDIGEYDEPENIE